MVTSKTKKYITVTCLVLLAAANISLLAGYIPVWLYSSVISNISLFDIVGYTGLVAAYWVGTRQTD